MACRCHLVLAELHIDVQVFQSHCAPESRDNQSFGQMTVALLKKALSEKSLSTGGRKAELVARLEAAVGVASPSGAPSEPKQVCYMLSILPPKSARGGGGGGGCVLSQLEARFDLRDSPAAYKLHSPAGTSFVDFGHSNLSTARTRCKQSCPMSSMWHLLFEAGSSRSIFRPGDPAVVGACKHERLIISLKGSHSYRSITI